MTKEMFCKVVNGKVVKYSIVSYKTEKPVLLSAIILALPDHHGYSVKPLSKPESLYKTARKHGWEWARKEIYDPSFCFQSGSIADSDFHFSILREGLQSLLDVEENKILSPCGLAGCNPRCDY